MKRKQTSADAAKQRPVDGARRRIVIADDHPLVRHALQKILLKLDKLEIAEADSFASLKTLLDGETADLVLLDLKMPGVEGFSCLAYLRQQYPELPIAIVSGNTQAGVIRNAFELGAVAFIPKTLEVPKLTGALQQVLAGGRWTPTAAKESAPPTTKDSPRARLDRLTPQQLRVLGLLARGRLNKQIAFELGMKEATVKGHITTILLRLGLRRRTEAALFAQRMLQIS